MTPLLQPVGPGLFYAEGDVSFYGVQIQTRMSVAQLEGDELWVCSPLLITDEIANALDSLGRVAHVLSPNKIHNQGLDGSSPRWSSFTARAEP